MSSPFSFVWSTFTLLSSSINSKDPNRGRCFWCFTYLPQAVSRVAFDENENEREKGERKRWVLSFLRGGRGGGVTEVDLRLSPVLPILRGGQRWRAYGETDCLLVGGT